MKIITWVDLQGVYRVTSLAYYTELNKPQVGTRDQTEDEAIEAEWQKILGATEGYRGDVIDPETGIPPRLIRSKYGLPSDHPFHVVDNVAAVTRTQELGGQYFRCGANGLGVDGAWEMGAGGLPVVDMVQARVVHMEHIRLARNAELDRIDITPQYRAAERSRISDPSAWDAIEVIKQALRDLPATFDVSQPTTPQALKDLWPAGLPERE